MEISSPAPTPVLPTPSILDPSHPLAYLAYLPEDAAYELTISVYLLVAALVVSRIVTCHSLRIMGTDLFEGTNMGCLQ